MNGKVTTTTTNILQDEKNVANITDLVDEKLISNKKKPKKSKKKKKVELYFQNVKNIDEIASVGGDDIPDDHSFASSCKSGRSTKSSRSYAKPVSNFLSKLVGGMKNSKFDDMDDSNLLDYDQQQMEADYELNRSEHDEMSRPWNHHNAKFNKVRHVDEKRVTSPYDTNSNSHYHHHETMLDVMERLAMEDNTHNTSNSGGSNHDKPVVLVMQTKQSSGPAARKSMLEVMESLTDKPLTMAKSAYHTVKRRGSLTSMKT